MTQHVFIPASLNAFDPNCSICEGKDRDAIHSAHRNDDKAVSILWNAAQYLYRNQMGQPSRVKAMDLLDDIRRNYLKDDTYARQSRALMLR